MNDYSLIAPTIFRNASSTLSNSMKTMCMTQDHDKRVESVKDLLSLLKKGDEVSVPTVSLFFFFNLSIIQIYVD